jgi:sodium/hydrogen antiporter
MPLGYVASYAIGRIEIFPVTLLSLGLIVIFGLVFLVSLISAPIKSRLPISEPLLALMVGVFIGLGAYRHLYAVGQVASRDFVHEFAEITLAIALMTTALQVPAGYLRRHWRGALILLGIGMPAMWIASSAIVYLVLGLPIGIAVYAGAAITPTDPVLASTIVSGDVAEDNIPARIRHLVTVESGANDGLAYGFALLPLALFSMQPHDTIGDWAAYTAVWAVGGAILCGAALGVAAGTLTNWSLARRATEHSSFLGLTLALSLVTLGALKLAGTDAILGVFAAGLAFSATLDYRGHQLERAEHLQAAVERFFDLPVFIVLGAILPWQQWLAMGWRAIVLTTAVLLFRRIPVVLALTPVLGKSLQRVSESLFVGWFGPIGISALFYATLEIPDGVASAVWAPITLVIVASIVAHGVTATPMTRWFGRHLDRLARRHQTEEGTSVEEHQQHIGRHVRTAIREDAQRDIQDIVSSHLILYRKQALEHHQRDRVDRMRRLVAEHVPAEEAAGSNEAITELSQEIARHVAEHLSDSAASEVGEMISHNADEDQEADQNE